MKNTQEYLPHLKNAVPIKGYGNRLSMYLIALEAWRRGLNVKFFLKENPDNRLLIRYTIGDGANEYHFESSLGDKLTTYAYEICENKDETKNVLSQAGIPVPEGQRFTSDKNKNEIIDYANMLGYPLVIKPISENAGKGVFSNIQSKEKFRESLFYVRDELGYKDIIVEKHITGIEHRIFLVNGEVIAVTNRMPANIIADGIHSIEELIDIKNKSKQSNPTVASKLIEMDKEVTESIKSLGYDYSTIPPIDEKIYLRTKSNVSAGGDSIDMTDNLTPELRKLAEEAMNSIEGLNVCGLDMIIDKELNKGVIIEINTKPMVGLHVFPVEGKPRDVVSPIIDDYFPATKGKEKSILYFDFDAVISPLRDRSVKEVELSPPSQNHLYSYRYILIGTFEESFESEVRLLALNKGLHGYLNETSESQYELVIASEREQAVNSFIKEIQNLDLIIDLFVEEYEYNFPVKIGFEVNKISKSHIRMENQRKRIRSLNQKIKNQNKLISEYHNELIDDRRQNSALGERIINLEKENNRNRNKIDRLVQERELIQKEIQEMLDSNSWKVTKPLRSIRTIFK